MVLELYGTIMYERPRITDISHALTDARLEGGAAVVRITMLGDPGLRASFDISPGIAAGEPMKEIEDGRYAGEFSFPPDIVGGPYTVIGRLRHADAGETVRRDPNALTIPLLSPAR